MSIRTTVILDDGIPLVGDTALVAALALENGASVASCDQDFSRFTGIRWINPLTAY